ncbi:branched-chain amino acid ABC transporter permease [Roseovarius amoyensis]|uniref:branched-chain amino acid ABC transporter permease n=1 Tax=Roseovarius amoyensis TaxID=2211448 RepID=UPI000DBE86F4|nr:branched-chain amino acid ABC transporter permease [Roseovarius amoyensis]
MQLFLQQIINGLLLGGMFALMSIGLSMVFGIMKTVNFAYGALYMVGGYAAYWSAELLGLSLLPALICAFLIMFAVGAVIEIIGFGQFRGNDDASLIFGLGLSLVLKGGAVLAWGSQNRFIGDNSAPAIELGPFIVPYARMTAGIASLALIGLIYLLIARTGLGRTFRAVADNAERAQLLGIDPRLINVAVFGFGTAIAAVACVLLTPVYSLSPAVDDTALFTAFTVVILGGLGSIAGCLVAGLILGVIYTLSFAYLISNVAPIVPLLVLILTLILRPQGLFGQKERLA